MNRPTRSWGFESGTSLAAEGEKRKILDRRKNLAFRGNLSSLRWNGSSTRGGKIIITN